jgi:hypothetical protein
MSGPGRRWKNKKRGMKMKKRKEEEAHERQHSEEG